MPFTAWWYIAKAAQGCLISTNSLILKGYWCLFLLDLVPYKLLKNLLQYLKLTHGYNTILVFLCRDETINEYLQ